MPGGRNTTYHMGDRTELLVQFVLGSVAFTTPVPRQEDIGHDFLCVLKEPRGEMVWAGPSFAVQVKSNADSLVFQKEYELRWVREQENPFFVAVGDKKRLRVDFYSTVRRHSAFLYRSARRVTLKFSSPPRGKDWLITAPDESTQTIFLGRPIASVGLAAFKDPSKLDKLRTVLRSWIVLDRENIANRHAGMYWAVTPATYRTGIELAPGGPSDTRIFWNPKNLDICMRNFARASAALRLTVEAASPTNKKRFPAQIGALEASINAFADAFDPGARAALKRFCGMDLD